MQQVKNAAGQRLGARFTATEPTGHLERGPDAPAPWGRFGRGEIRFGRISRVGGVGSVLGFHATIKAL
jgi:hypothetical protein